MESGGLVIIGGSKGIGKSIIRNELNKRPIWNISRTPSDFADVTQFQVDILSGDLPEIENISSLVYCPGSINLKPISSLKLEDFRADLELNVLGAVKAIKKYHKQLRRSDNASIYSVL